MVEQRRRAAEQGKITAADACKQAANGVVPIRILRRCKQQARRLSPDLLPGRRECQPLAWQRKRAPKLPKLGATQIRHQRSFGIVGPDILIPERALDCTAKALRGRKIEFAQHQIDVHLNRKISWVWVGAGVDALILCFWCEPGAVQAPCIAIAGQFFQHSLPSGVGRTASDSPHQRRIIRVGSDRTAQRANRWGIWQAMVAHQSVAFDLGREMRARPRDYIIKAMLAREWRKQIHQH